MIQKIKELILGWVYLCVLILIVLLSIASFKNTDKTYVCSGSVQEYNKQSYNVNVKFEIKDSYSIYGNRYITATMLDNYPYVFHHSKDTTDMNKNPGTIFLWDKTYYGADLGIYISHENSQVITFNFKTKILNATFWGNSGHTKMADYNLICKEVK
jgi:hypothetical protein